MGHLVHAVEVTPVTLLLTDNENVGKWYNIAVHIDVGRVFHPRQAIDIERVAVQLGSQFVGGVGPYAIRSLGQRSHPWGVILASTGNLDGACGQEVTGHLHFDRLGGKKVESHCSVGVDDGWLNVGTVKEFLLCRGTDAATHKGNYSQD